jgi:hypothetical protein
MPKKLVKNHRPYSNETRISYVHVSASDVRDLARSLLANSECHKIINNAGMDSAITKANKAVLWKTALSYMIQEKYHLFYDQNDKQAARFFPYDFQTAIALCRRIISNRFSGFDDPEVQEFLQSNLYKYIKPRKLSNAEHVKEALLLAKLLYTDKNSVQVLEKQIKTGSWEKLDVTYITEKHNYFAEIYGIRPRANGVSEFELIRMMLRGEIHSLDDQAAVIYLERYAEQQSGFPGIEPTIRNWGYSNV